jgi:hypothetical protein
MAHYAFLDENNIVTEVITGRNENEVAEGISDWEKYYGDFRGQKCIRTSYNHNIRGKYACIGDTYSFEEDIFIEPQPYLSWIRNGSFWEAPTPMPVDDNLYIWDEETLSWEEVAP